jgi:hypothetical protein
MARRTKAQSRQARQRRSSQRAAQRPASPRPAPSLTPEAAELSETAFSPSQSTSTRSAAATAVSRATVPASQRGSRVNPRLTVAGPSRLSERAIEEYHYVSRDLRNIAVLVAVMVVILVVAVIAFTALGIGKTA